MGKSFFKKNFNVHLDVYNIVNLEFTYLEFHLESVRRASCMFNTCNTYISQTIFTHKPPHSSFKLNNNDKLDY